MKRMTTALVALCAVVGLAGCSSDSEEASSPEESAVATTAAPTSEAPGATTAQWASLVAEGKAGAVDAYASWNDGDCLALDLEPGNACLIRLATMQPAADTLSIYINGGTNTQGELFIGDPPAEIADLVTSTQEAADTASKSVAEASAGCPGDTCRPLAIRALADYSSLMAKLDGWGPYGG